MKHLGMAVALLMALWVSGCSSVGYYLQAVNGHAQLMHRSRDIEQVLSDETVPESLKERLGLVLEMRDFATRHLGLPDNNSYRSYAELAREAVVWSVVATPEFSIHPRQWCYPVVGCASYRGYFDPADARAEAGRLAAAGADSMVGPAAAYSTLGWFDDPLPSSVAGWPEGRLAGLMFHELAHQQLYLPGDSQFNESFANAVEQAGVRRWLMRRGDNAGWAQWQRYSVRERQFVQLLLATRRRLDELYQRPLPVGQRRALKRRQFEQLRSDYARLRGQWQSGPGFDEWFERPLNNARLALVGTYQQWVPGFSELLCRVDGDFAAWYAEAERLAQLPVAERVGQLRSLNAAYTTRRSCE